MQTQEIGIGCAACSRLFKARSQCPRQAYCARAANSTLRSTMGPTCLSRSPARQQCRYRNDYERVWTHVDASRALTGVLRLQTALRWMLSSAEESCLVRNGNIRLF